MKISSDVKKIWYVVVAIIVISAGAFYFAGSAPQAPTVAPGTAQVNPGGVNFSTSTPSNFPSELLPPNAFNEQFNNSLTSMGVIFAMRGALPQSADNYLAQLPALKWTVVTKDIESSSASFAITNPVSGAQAQIQMTPLPDQSTVVIISIQK